MSEFGAFDHTPMLSHHHELAHGIMLEGLKTVMECIDTFYTDLVRPRRVRDVDALRRGVRGYRKAGRDLTAASHLPGTSGGARPQPATSDGGASEGAMGPNEKKLREAIGPRRLQPGRRQARSTGPTRGSTSSGSWRAARGRSRLGDYGITGATPNAAHDAFLRLADKMDQQQQDLDKAGDALSDAAAAFWDAGQVLEDHPQTQQDPGSFSYDPNSDEVRGAAAPRPQRQGRPVQRRVHRARDGLRARRWPPSTSSTTSRR